MPKRQASTAIFSVLDLASVAAVSARSSRIHAIISSQLTARMMGPTKQPEDAMRQHSAQDTDEDDKHGRIQPTSMSIGLRILSANPDQEIDRQRKSQGKVAGSESHADDGHKDDSRPDLQDGRTSTRKANTPA